MYYGKNVTFEIIESIGILTLSDPPENYLPLPEFIPLPLLQDWLNNETLKGLIIRGEGRNFSAGGDLGKIFTLAGQPAGLEDVMVKGHELLRYIELMDIPVIAAINRVCFGGGLEIALACHFRVASENALLAFPEVNLNLMPGMGGTYRLPAIAGTFQSARMILGGDIVSAARAREIGLVDHIAPKDKAWEYSLELMLKMTRERPVKVIRHVMTAIRNSILLGREEAAAGEVRLFCELAADESARRKTEENNTVLTTNPASNIGND